MKQNSQKEQAAFIAAGMISLADMSGTELRELTGFIGVDAIRELLAMDTLRFEISPQEMAEEICAYADWEPTLYTPYLNRTAVERLGGQIAEMLDTVCMEDESVAENLVLAMSSKRAAEIIAAGSMDCLMEIAAEPEIPVLDW